MDKQSHSLGALETRAEALKGEGRSVILVARAGKHLGLIATADAPRPAAMTLSRATLQKMRQNLWWAICYKLIAFPIAAGVFNPFRSARKSRPFRCWAVQRWLWSMESLWS